MKITNPYKLESTKSVSSNLHISQIFEFDEGMGSRADSENKDYEQESWMEKPPTCTRLEGKTGFKALFSLQKYGTWYPEHSLSSDEEESPLADELLGLFERLS